MARKKWYAIVIGAGPAGASAARTLVAGGLDCLLIEKKRLPRHKMCSGMLSPWAVLVRDIYEDKRVACWRPWGRILVLRSFPGGQECQS